MQEPCPRCGFTPEVQENPRSEADKARIVISNKKVHLGAAVAASVLFTLLLLVVVPPQELVARAWWWAVVIAGVYFICGLEISSSIKQIRNLQAKFPS